MQRCSFTDGGVPGARRGSHAGGMTRDPNASASLETLCTSTSMNAAHPEQAAVEGFAAGTRVQGERGGEREDHGGDEAHQGGNARRDEGQERPVVGGRDGAVRLGTSQAGKPARGLGRPSSRAQRGPEEQRPEEQQRPEEPRAGSTTADHGGHRSTGTYDPTARKPR